MNEDWRNELRALADRWCDASGLSLATLGTRTVKDGAFFARLAAGKGCTVDTYLHVRRWIEADLARLAAVPPAPAGSRVDGAEALPRAAAAPTEAA